MDKLARKYNKNESNVFFTCMFGHGLQESESKKGNLSLFLFFRSMQLLIHALEKV